MRHMMIIDRLARWGLARPDGAGDGTGQGRGHPPTALLLIRIAVPFYTTIGFVTVGEVEVPLRPRISFSAMRMLCDV
jgi:hypothetical protein